MFATSASAASHEPSLASRVWGHLVTQRAQGAGAVPQASVVPAAQVAAAEDDDLPDLAQRVREVGEW